MPIPKPKHTIDSRTELVDLVVQMMRSRHTVKCHPRFTHIGEELGCKRCSLQAHFHRMVAIGRNRELIEDLAAAKIEAQYAKEGLR